MDISIGIITSRPDFQILLCHPFLDAALKLDMQMSVPVMWLFPLRHRGELKSSGRFGSTSALAFGLPQSHATPIGVVASWWRRNDVFSWHGVCPKTLRSGHWKGREFVLVYHASTLQKLSLCLTIIYTRSRGFCRPS